MAIYNITTNAKNTLNTNIEAAKTLLNNRRELWRKLTPEKQAAWKENCPDPVISLIYKLHLYLKDFFGD